MSYLQAMLQKKVEKEQLPRGVQLKIENLQNAIEKISEYENQDDLDDDDNESLELLRENAKKLDAEIEKAILKFDPEKYQKKLEVMMQVRAKRKQGKKEEENPNQPETKEEVNDEKSVQENIENLKQNVHIAPQDLEDFEDELCEGCQEDLETGKITINDIRAKQAQFNQEEEEFEKVSDAKPRKLSKSVIIMGIGAFILTWGAVNFFRERRG